MTGTLHWSHHCWARTANFIKNGKYNTFPIKWKSLDVKINGHQKSYGCTHNLSPGTMMFYDQDTQRLVAIEIMKTAETPQMIYDFIVASYPPGTTPNCIIYDFACQLQRFCVLRDPERFKNTLFLIDPLHVHNHSSKSAKTSQKKIKMKIGSCGYLLDSQLYVHEKLISANPGISEQKNSIMARCKQLVHGGSSNQRDSEENRKLLLFTAYIIERMNILNQSNRT